MQKSINVGIGTRSSLPSARRLKSAFRCAWVSVDLWFALAEGPGKYHDTSMSLLGQTIKAGKFGGGHVPLVL
jgi:hypothetical protein